MSWIMNKFEWDENKRTLNLEKHGIDFVDAIDVFMDLRRLVKMNAKHTIVKKQGGKNQLGCCSFDD